MITPKQIKAFTESTFPSTYEKLRSLRKRFFGSYLDAPDRHLLEKVIIPYLVSQADLKRVLFVGCEWYTKPYESLFKQKEYWTIELDPDNAIYGARNHIVDRVQNLTRYFSNDYFDLIICNGIIGYGVNTLPDMEETFAQCFQCLRAKGILVVGWNDIPERNIPPFENCNSLNQFYSYIFPPISTSKYLTNTHYRHAYNFYIKP